MNIPTPEEMAVTHADLLNQIVTLEKKLSKATLWLLSTVLPLVIGSFIWIWASHSAQAGVNAEMQIRLQNHEKTEDRVLQKLDELSLFLREDSKDLRQELLEHIKEET